MDVKKILAGMKETFAEVDAEIARHASTDWFKDYPPAVKALTKDTTEHALVALQEALDNGADPEATAPDGATAVRLALDRKSLAAIVLLHRAGAKFEDRNWGPLHRAVLFGSLEDVVALATPAACAELDLRDWSPLLLACALGQTEAAKVLWPHTPPEARCVATDEKESALLMAAAQLNGPLVEWLLDQGVPVDWADKYGRTPLLAAVENDGHAVVEMLLKRGANPNPQHNTSARSRDGDPATHPAANIANMVLATMSSLFSNPFAPKEDKKDSFNTPMDWVADAEMLRLLLRYGFPLNDVSSEWICTAIGADLVPDPQASAEDLAEDPCARAGHSNPERVAPPFWVSQIRSGASGYGGATALLGADADHPHPVWSFDRFGRSITELPDGRVVCIGGEHEDFYSRDFCIYADVTVFDRKGGLEHYIYPADVFPPTDFHTATLVGDTIWLIGSLGYSDARGDVAQVLTLSTKDWSIRKVQCHGDDPGWVSKHKAMLEAGRITLWNGWWPNNDGNASGFWSLDLSSHQWRREGHA